MSLNTYVNSISLGNTLNINAKLNVNGSTNILSNSYISFGTNFESTSYGLRDNNGVIEFKNNNGSWLPVLALNNIVDNTLSGNKIIDNTLNPTKILNYPTDGTKYLSGDGTWKVVSGGSGTFTGCPTPVNSTDVANKSYVDTSLTYNLFSLNGINANLFLVANDGNDVAYFKASLNTIIGLLGGTVSTTLNGTGIYINAVIIGNGISITTVPGFTTNGYNSSYDAILYWSNNGPNADTKTILDLWYNNNKGVVLGVYAVGTFLNTSTFLVNVSKKITTFNNTSTANTTITINNSSDIIVFGVTSLYVSCSQFDTLNGSTSVVSSGFNPVNYLDDITGKGRRVDLNYNPIYSPYDNTTTSTNRCTLQALLWAARKIDNNNTSRKLNLNATELQSLKVYNTPTTDFDVLNKKFFNTYIKTVKALTTTDFIVPVDLTKPHVFTVYYNGVYNPSYNMLLYTFPLNGVSMTYKILFGMNYVFSDSLTNNVAGIGPGTLTLYGGNIYVFSNLSIVNNQLKIVPYDTTKALQCYEL